NGLITANQALADVYGAVPSVLTVNQGLSLMLAIGASGPVSLQAICGIEIGMFIANNQLTSAQVNSAIGSAVTAQTIPADQAVVMLAGIAANVSGAAITAAGAEVAALVAAGLVTAASAMNDINNTAPYMGADRAINMLAGVAANGSAALQAAVGGE